MFFNYKLMLSLVWLSLIFGAEAKAQTQYRLMSYNLLNFPDGRDDCGSNVVVPARWDTLQKIVKYALPDVLMVCELQHEAGADSILNRALNADGNNRFARAAFVLNRSSNLNRDLNNMLFYDQNKFTLLFQEELLTNVRDIGHYQLLVNESIMFGSTDSVILDFYLTHLKAAAADSLSRLSACQIISAHLAAHPEQKNVFFGGDFNFYSSNEPGYAALMAAGLADPIARPGNWSSNSAFADVHTQATRLSSSPTYFDCGATGGLDDRFDFILAKDSVLQNAGPLRYVPNSYKALGNNGSSYNTYLYNPINTDAAPDSIKHALFHMSDHLPVVMDLSLEMPRPSLGAILGQTLGNWQAKNAEGWHQFAWSWVQSPARAWLEGSSDGISFETLFDDALSALAFSTSAYQARYYRLAWRASAQSDVQYSSLQYLEHQGFVLKMYPNPTSGLLHLELPKSAFWSLNLHALFSGSSHLLKEGEFQACSLDLGAFPAGLYLLEVRNEGICYRFKVEKKP